MTLITTFALSQKRCHPSLYRLARLLAPSSVQVDRIKIEARSGEAPRRVRITMLIALCRAFGLRRTKFGDPGTYGFVVDREYGESDLALCEYLCIVGVQERILRSEDGRDARGRLTVPALGLTKLRDFGQLKHWIVMAQETRKAIEEGGFCGIGFREVVIEGLPTGSTSAEYWELTASVTLPGLANTNRLMCYGTSPTGKVEPFAGDYSRMVFVNDPPYALGEIHYRRGDLKALGRFDIAETLEHLWIPQRSLVISQTLYRALRSREIPVVVRPVRIDGESPR
jgi:hypothetical protein